MPEPFSTEQLNQLRQRWERDPKSRAFLQLAEEYRRAGRLADAIPVLRSGLGEHPTYLAAQVALGRCLVETGDAAAAIDILERAVARDPTQLVANKLLVEAYIATGQASRARERLDLYRLFNDRDAEIELLSSRIGALERPAPESAAAPRGTTRPNPGEALFVLPAIAALPAVNLEPVAPPPARFVDRDGEPFGALDFPEAARRIDESFFAQGIFVLAPAEPAPTELVEAGEAAPRDWESDSWPTGSPQLEAVDSLAPATPIAPLAARPGLTEPAALPTGPEPSAEPLFPAPSEFVLEPEPSPLAPMVPMVPIAPLAPVDFVPPSEAPPTASATLGELYLSQGHLDEAEESFLSVLESRPGDGAALAGLESVRLQRGDESGAFAEEVAVAEESNVIVGGLTARKAALLRDFLARIRRGAERHVS